VHQAGRWGWGLYATSFSTAGASALILGNQRPKVVLRSSFRSSADPAFANKEALIDELMETAWDGYRKARKSPITQKAGPEFADPDCDLSVDWLAARNAIDDAQTRHEGVRPNRVLLICGAARNDKTCPARTLASNELAWNVGRDPTIRHRGGLQPVMDSHQTI
jgi:hypothetical protein